MAKKFRDLTEQERSIICNGCGGKGGWIKPPQFIFKSSCDHHDYNYFLGFKEQHRKKADIQFYESMKEQAYNSYDSELQKLVADPKRFMFWVKLNLKRKLVSYYAAAYIYYKAVRFGGKKYFYYGEKEQEF